MDTETGFLVAFVVVVLCLTAAIILPDMFFTYQGYTRSAVPSYRMEWVAPSKPLAGPMRNVQNAE
jgi:hypothetical protein